LKPQQILIAIEGEFVILANQKVKTITPPRIQSGHAARLMENAVRNVKIENRK